MGTMSSIDKLEEIQSKDLGKQNRSMWLCKPLVSHSAFVLCSCTWTIQWLWS